MKMVLEIGKEKKEESWKMQEEKEEALQCRTMKQSCPSVTSRSREMQAGDGIEKNGVHRTTVHSVKLI